MNHQVPCNFGPSCDDPNDQMGQPSMNNIMDDFQFPDFNVTDANPSLGISPPADIISSPQLVDQVFEDPFGGLMEVYQLSQTPPLEAANKIKGQSSSGTQEKPDQTVPLKCPISDEMEFPEELVRRKQNDLGNKRTRSAELHNFHERRRRDRINQKLKNLQELIPNCNKSDRISVLDDAINYIKALRFQLEMMTTGRGQFNVAPSGGIQSTQVFKFFPFVTPMTPNFRWNMCHPMIPAVRSSASVHPSSPLLPGGIRLPLMPNPGSRTVIPQLQMSFDNHPQQLPSSFDTSEMLK